ncbi:MAG: OsmC family protein [Candidatus Acidiferrales bacterium]
MQDSYVFHVDATRTRGRSGQLSAAELPTLEFSAPPEFAGEPGKWTPEHLLVAAVASCFTATFSAVAEAIKLRVEAFKMRAFGRLENLPGEGYRFTGITLKPEIQVAHEDTQAALKALAKAEKHCFVAQSLRTTVQVEPHFVATPAEVVG